MKKRSLSSLIFSICFFASILAQDGNTLINQDFPASWQGSWAGVLQIYNAKGLQQDLPMQLIITLLKILMISPSP